MSNFYALPAYGVGAVILIVLYAIQSEIRFGAKARTLSAEASDRGSTRALSFASAVPLIGFILVMKGYMPEILANAIPGLPVIGWIGVGLGSVGILIRFWAVLTLRERYTRTLLVHQEHPIERGGPYRFVRHPGYLGSLLCLNGIALASGNAFVFGASLITTLAAYAYRIRAEDKMLIAALGAAYESYQREVAALVPFLK